MNIVSQHDLLQLVKNKQYKKIPLQQLPLPLFFYYYSEIENLFNPVHHWQLLSLSACACVGVHRWRFYISQSRENVKSTTSDKENLNTFKTS